MTETTSAQQTETTSYKNGVPCWTDLTTSDPAAAKTFYSELFGWEVGPEGGSEVGGYTMIFQDEQPVCAISPQQQGQKDMGVPPMWNSYIAVDSADETTAKAKQAGGNILSEPFDVMEFGRMSIIMDPTGAVFETWEAKSHPGAGLVNEPVSMVWNELNTRDADAAADFYGKTFGWQAGALEGGPMPYFELKNTDGALIGGMMPMSDQIPEQVPAHWLVYFAVADTDATLEKAKQLGGSVMVPPIDIPAGRFTILQDPQGATFAAIKMAG
jgi:hypothetical protein